MIQKIYDRKLKAFDILISGQSPYDIDIDGCPCFGGSVSLRCICDLEILKNETGKEFPNDITLSVWMELVNKQHFIENILIFRSHKMRKIAIQYGLYRKPLPKQEKLIKSHFITSDDDPYGLMHRIKPNVNIYDTILKDIGLLSLYAFQSEAKSSENTQECTEKENGTA